MGGLTTRVIRVGLQQSLLDDLLKGKQLLEGKNLEHRISHILDSIVKASQLRENKGLSLIPFLEEEGNRELSLTVPYAVFQRINHIARQEKISKGVAICRFLRSAAHHYQHPLDPKKRDEMVRRLP